MKIHGMWFGMVLLFSAAAQAQEIGVKVEQLGQLGTQTSHKGDRVSGRVVSPPALNGDLMEGKVNDVRAGGANEIVSARSRSGPELSTLTPNAAPATAPAAAPAAAAAPAVPPVAAAAPAAPAGTSSQSNAQPDLTTLKDDFIPGEKVLLYDDFSDMSPDEPPPHWKVRGAALTLKVAPDYRQITATERVTMTPVISGFPKNFTLEMELKQDNYGRAEWDFYQKASGNVDLQVYTEYEPSDNQLEVYVRVKDEETLINQEFPVDLSQWIREAIWVQNGRLRVYVNGKKVTDNNQLDLPGFETAQLISAPFTSDASVSYRLVRIAESTPDFSQVISASGRFVTHGINFDTDSDRLKPESAAVIKSVAQGLQKDPNLKLLIEGHTDSTGSADHNLDLSKRRAEAVKTVLVSQFGVDASRLTTAGLGATKPMDTNDTPQGRAQNRRVEFVRQ